MKHCYHLLALCGLSLSQIETLSAYDLHEWGTFTTVSGSDGGLLTGLHVEEEQLPSFVYSHLGMRPRAHGHIPIYSVPQVNVLAQNTHQMFVLKDDKNVLQEMRGMKGMPVASLKNVTVKMETPVIYFYGDDTAKVNVKVGFNGGTISQWYPQRMAGDTPNKVTKDGAKLSEALAKSVGDRELVMFEPIDFSKAYEGGIEWDVEIIPKGDADETLNVANHSEEEIPFAFAFENVGGKFRYKTLGSVPVGGVAKVAESEWVTPSKPAMQQVEVFQEMRAGLTAQGLTEDEANGMVKTWWRSYFNKPGLRVFWVVPDRSLSNK